MDEPRTAMSDAINTANVTANLSAIVKELQEIRKELVGIKQAISDLNGAPAKIDAGTFGGT